MSPPLSVAAVPARLPQPCSVRFLVEQFLDISAVPRRSFFEVLATFATNEMEREKLVEFSSAQGQDSLHSYCNRPRRTALEVRGHVDCWCEMIQLFYDVCRLILSSVVIWSMRELCACSDILWPTKFFMWLLKSVTSEQVVLPLSNVNRKEGKYLLHLRQHL